MLEKADGVLKSDSPPTSNLVIKKLQQLFGKLKMNETADTYIDTVSIELHLLEEMQICVYLMNYSTGQYLYVNNHMAKLTGIPREEIQKGGFNILERIIHPVDYLPALEIVRKAGEQILKLSADEHKSVSFKLFYRLKTAGGAYCNVMQMNKMIVYLLSYVLKHNCMFHCLNSH